MIEGEFDSDRVVEGAVIPLMTSEGQRINGSVVEHRLVSDDVVEIRLVSDVTLVGSAPDITHPFAIGLHHFLFPLQSDDQSVQSRLFC